MRARNIKPSFFLNEKLTAVSAHHRLLYIGLWCYADREGRFEWIPKRIAAAIFPYENVKIESLLKDLADGGFLIQYSVFGCIPKFKDHQSPHPHEAKSKIPAPSQQVIDKWMSLHCNYNVTTMSPQCPSDIIIPDVRNDDVGKKAASDKSDLAARLESVKQNPAYKGIDIDKEYNKMKAWCEANKRIPSYKRFINWLNRIERPMALPEEQPKKMMTLEEAKASQEKAGREATKQTREYLERLRNSPKFEEG